MKKKPKKLYTVSMHSKYGSGICFRSATFPQAVNLAKSESLRDPKNEYYISRKPVGGGHSNMSTAYTCPTYKAGKRLRKPSVGKGR